MKRYELTDEQWDKIKNYFENKRGRPYKNLRYQRHHLDTENRSNVAGFAVHQDSGSKKSRGGNTTKIHTLVDALGNPVKIEISTGQVSDHIFAPKLLEGLKPQIVMADGGYDSVKFRQQIEGAVACIPRHRNRKAKFPFDKEQYKNAIW